MSPKFIPVKKTLPTATDTYIYGYAFSGSILVILNTQSNTNGFWTEDGENWTKFTHSLSDNSPEQVSKLAYGNGVFVTKSIANNGKILYSLDGKTWNLVTPTNLGFTTKVVFGNNIFICLDSYASNVLYSSDGINWNYSGTSKNFGGGARVTFGNGIFVTSGYNSSSLAVSTNGTTWTTKTHAYSDSFWYGLNFAGDKFFNQGNTYKGQFEYSIDGNTWTIGYFPFNFSFQDKLFSYGMVNDIYYYAVIAYAGSPTKTFLYSLNGIEWSVGTLPNNVNDYSTKIYFFKNRAFVVLADRYFISLDMINWTEVLGTYQAGTHGISAFDKFFTFSASSTKSYIEITADELFYAITPDDYFKRYQPFKTEELRNSISIFAKQYALSEEIEEVGSLDNIIIEAGGTENIEIAYTSYPCKNLGIGLENGDYDEDTTTFEPATSCEITSYNLYPCYGTATIVNNSGETANIKIVVYGRKIYIRSNKIALQEDETSISKYGKKEFSISENHLIQDYNHADTLAIDLLASYKDPRKDQRLEWRGNPALELGDQTELPEYNKQGQDIKGKYRIIKNQLNFDGTLKSTTEFRKEI